MVCMSMMSLKSVQKTIHIYMYLSLSSFLPFFFFCPFSCFYFEAQFLNWNAHTRIYWYYMQTNPWTYTLPSGCLTKCKYIYFAPAAALFMIPKCFECSILAYYRKCFVGTPICTRIYIYAYIRTLFMSPQWQFCTFLWSAKTKKKGNERK